MIADGDAEDIRGQMPERLPAVAGSLTVHHPISPPDRRIDQVQQTLAPHDVADRVRVPIPAPSRWKRQLPQRMLLIDNTPPEQMRAMATEQGLRPGRERESVFL
jgi:hypothetical protein